MSAERGLGAARRISVVGCILMAIAGCAPDDETGPLPALPTRADASNDAPDASDDAPDAELSVPGCATVSTSADANVDAICARGGVGARERIVRCVRGAGPPAALGCSPIDGDEALDADFSVQDFCCAF